MAGHESYRPLLLQDTSYFDGCSGCLVERCKAASKLGGPKKELALIAFMVLCSECCCGISIEAGGRGQAGAPGPVSNYKLVVPMKDPGDAFVSHTCTSSHQAGNVTNCDLSGLAVEVFRRCAHNLSLPYEFLPAFDFTSYDEILELINQCGGDRALKPKCTESRQLADKVGSREERSGSATMSAGYMEVLRSSKGRHQSFRALIWKLVTHATIAINHSLS
ncbi:hypothetical protein GOP47_0019552 [Adiantum capillus-veneris]|uniref:Uncharacterized protein n=1 Tax=Adiantum capillus-veneris TaxID=13818 RepID=A0A9D4UC09_ADICA|nr:hypothetical protein GOP47_0019552 [Adiantum capillus-veneris]